MFSKKVFQLNQNPMFCFALQRLPKRWALPKAKIEEYLCLGSILAWVTLKTCRWNAFEFTANIYFPATVRNVTLRFTVEITTKNILSVHSEWNHFYNFAHGCCEYRKHQLRSCSAFSMGSKCMAKEFLTLQFMVVNTTNMFAVKI